MASGAIGRKPVEVRILSAALPRRAVSARRPTGGPIAARCGRSLPRRSAPVPLAPSSRATRLRPACGALLRSRPYSSSVARVWGPGGLRLARDCRSARQGLARRPIARACPLGGVELPGLRPSPARVDELPAEYCYLLGLYLGDGCISAGPRDVYRLRIHLDLAYPGIVDECETAIQAVAPRNRVHRLLRTSNYTKGPEPSLVEVSAYSRAWPCLFPQHGPGRKHEREIKLVAWQRALVQRHARSLLRGLIHSDGCQFHQHRSRWLDLPEVRVQQQVGRHPQDLRGGLRRARSQTYLRAQDCLRVPQGGGGGPRRLHRSQGVGPIDAAGPAGPGIESRPGTDRKEPR